MKPRSILLTALFALLFNLIAQESVKVPFTDFLEKVELAEESKRQALIDEFILTLESTPITETSTAYFIYIGNASSVAVAGDFNFWNPTNSTFSNISGTDFWYRKEEFSPYARFDYKLVIDGSQWILDLKNPNQVSGGFGPNSELAMPEYEQPLEIERNPNVSKGPLFSESVKNAKTGKNYEIQVYTPPNYDEKKAYPSVYFQDGNEYLNLANANTILDNLIFNDQIKPVIGVFIIPTDRNLEYAEGEQFEYRDFFVDELVPFVDSTYATIKSAKSRAVLGDSYGGNIAAIIAFTRPDVFGNCGLHSGAFQADEYATNDIVRSEKKDIRVASIWGSYEGDLTNNMRKIKDHFVSNNYDLYWKELPEGHSWGLWRATLDDMLIHFFPNK